MRARRSISASASVFALATISSASCLARSISASRSLSADLAFFSYSFLSASASLRSASASASWSRINAILESSALPIAAGTFCPRRIAKTVSIASATQPPGSSPRKVISCSDMQLGLHRLRRLFGLDFDAGQAGDHVLGCLDGNGLDLRPRSHGRFADLALGRFDLEVDLVGRLLDLGFGL